MTDLATVAEPGDHTARLAAAFTATRKAAHHPDSDTESAGSISIATAPQVRAHLNEGDGS